MTQQSILNSEFLTTETVKSLSKYYMLLWEPKIYFSKIQESKGTFLTHQGTKYILLEKFSHKDLYKLPGGTKFKISFRLLKPDDPHGYALVSLKKPPAFCEHPTP